MYYLDVVPQHDSIMAHEHDLNLKVHVVLFHKVYLRFVYCEFNLY
jgi:hypothetical protein